MKTLLRFSSAPALSIASQGIGVAQLLAILWRVGANESTDAYFYLFNMGMLPTQVITVGVVFPMLLNRERITARAARLAHLLVPPLAVVLVTLGALWLVINGRHSPLIAPIVVLSAINAFFQAAAWIRAVGAEAEGDPNWISGIALPANTLGLATLLLPLPTDALVPGMVAALAIGNASVWIFMRIHGVGTQAYEGLPVSRTLGSRAEAWFLTKAGVSYGGIAILQSLAVLLPPSTVTILAISTKLVGSLVATFVNAVMPRIVHQSSSSIRPAMRFLSWTLLGGLSVGTVLAIAASFCAPTYLLSAIAVALWIIGAIASPVAQRAAYRHLEPNASRMTIFTVPLVVIAALVSARFPNFEIGTLLAAYALVDTATAVLLLVALRQWRIVVFVAAAVMATVCVWVISLYS